MKHKPVPSAFTLIELLIVVAIIAILAAIAVPNFLEAQTRSKISRVQSDMCTLATAVEAYTVDYNHTPMGFYEGTMWQPSNYGLSENDKILRNYSRLTTPIAYITSAPRDPFIELNGQIWYDGQVKSGAGYKLYHYQSVRTHSLQGRPLHYSYVESAERGVTFTFSSLGPSKRWTPDGWSGSRHVPWAPAKVETRGNEMGYPHLIYNATNGTMSVGDMSRSNFGVAE